VRSTSVVGSTSPTKARGQVSIVPAQNVHAAAAPAPDPLIALTQAVQAIPEEAWQAAQARVHAPLTVPDVSIDPLIVPPLVTPPIPDASDAPLAPGEP
jgi:hypothetical protein